MKQVMTVEDVVLADEAGARRSFRWPGGLVRLGRWYAQRQIYRQLWALEDWQLRDIGITRGDIHAVAAGTYRRA